MSKIVKSTYWTTGKFAPNYVPTKEEHEVALSRTLRIYTRDLEKRSSTVARFGDSKTNGNPKMETNEKCTKIQPCGHTCYDYLWQDGGGCSPCRVPITVIRDECGHKTTIFCNNVIPTSKCIVFPC